MTFKLTNGQEAAISMARDISKMEKGRPSVGILAGFGGTGKTSVLNFIEAEIGELIIICPTGKSALRVTEATALKASTLHRWHYRPVKNLNTNELTFTKKNLSEIHVPKSRLVVIDEASMINENVWNDIYETCTDIKCNILCVGDPFQLMPVTKDNKFGLLEQTFPYDMRVDLTEITRQAIDSYIIKASMQVRNMQPYEAVNSLPRVYDAKLLDTMEKVLSKNGVVICHRNVTRHLVNKLIRKHKKITEDLVAGEPLLVLQNNYELECYNGEVVAFEQWDWIDPKIYKIYDPYKKNMAEGKFGRGIVDGKSVALSIAGVKGELEDTNYSVIKKVAGQSCGHHVQFLHANYGYCLSAHKCVHPDTIVETSNGLERIKDLNRSSGCVGTGENLSNYSEFHEYKNCEMIKITTTDGYSITVTPNHRMIVKENFEEIKVVEAKDVKNGQFIRLKLGISEKDSVYQKFQYSYQGDVRAKTFNIPQVVDENFGEFLGLMVADGTIWKRGFRLVKRHLDVVTRFSELCKILFNFNTTDVKIFNAYGAEVNSVMICSVLMNINGISPNNKLVPDIILKSPLSVQASFLRGLFEDGSVHLYKKTGKLDHIEYSCKLEELAFIVQIMLLRQGIISSRKLVGGCWRIWIYGKNAHCFANKIGFISSFKNSRLELDTGDETRYSVPISQSERDKLWNSLSKSQKSNIQNRGNLSRNSLKNISSDVSSELIKFHYSKISKIEPSEISDSICVTVPEGVFLQNGMLLGNSQGSEYSEVLVVMEPSVNINTIEGCRWIYTAITRAKENVYISWNPNLKDML